MDKNSAILQLHFSPQTAKALDALIEEAGIHNFVNRELLSRDEIEHFVRLIVKAPLKIIYKYQ